MRCADFSTGRIDDSTSNEVKTKVWILGYFWKLILNVTSFRSYSVTSSSYKNKVLIKILN